VLRFLFLGIDAGLRQAFKRLTERAAPTVSTGEKSEKATPT
jgi:hypothetical protein